MNSADLNKIVLLPIRIKIILFIAIGILILLMGYFLSVKEKIEKCSILQEKQFSLQTESNQQQIQLLELKDNTKSNDKAQRDILDSLFTPMNLTQVLTALFAISHKNNVKVQLVEPQKVIVAKQLLHQPIKVLLFGNFKQFKNWFFALSANSFIYEIKQFSISSSTANDVNSLVLSIHLEIISLVTKEN